MRRVVGIFQKDFEMLVLSRRKNESIVLILNGKVIAKFTINDISTANKAKIGIEADSNIKILREELCQNTT